MTKSKKLRMQQRQQELLKHFEGDFYQEKKVGNEFYVKSFNGGTKKWQVAVFKEEAFGNYKSFSNVRKEEDELNEKFKEAVSIPFERPTLESVRKMVE